MTTETGTLSVDHARLPPKVRGLLFIRDQGLVVLWVILIAVFAAVGAPYFFTLATGLSVLNSAAITAIFAAGLAVGVMTGALDISVPGTAAVAGVVAGLALKGGVPVPLAILAALAVGVIVGIVNGLITIRGFDPLIVTIAMLSILSGVALVLAGGYNISGLQELTFIGTASYFGVPAPVLVTVALFVVLTIFLRMTRAGLRLLAVGGNAEGARRVGLGVNGYRILGFVISGTCAALGGVISAAYVTTASPAANAGTIFEALTAVALAGVPITGGRGSLPRVLLGAIVLATVSAGLLLAGVQAYWASVATGVLLLGALAVTKWTTNATSLLLVSGERGGRK